MNLTIIGNIIAFIASILMIIVSYIKKKNNIIKLQTIQMSLFVLSNFILVSSIIIVNGLFIIKIPFIQLYI